VKQSSLLTRRSTLAPFVTLLLASCSSASTTGANGSSSGAGPDAGATYHDWVVFTTKATFAGDLGGIAGADSKCQGFAAAAGLTGSFHAWLSDSTTDAADRVPNGGPWRKLHDGQQSDVVFENTAGWKGFPKAELDTDEFGAPPPLGDVQHTWTGTQIGGTKSSTGNVCSDWTSSMNSTDGTIGDRFQTDQGWTQWANYQPCDAQGAIVCYQAR
jgi:hypothetical protein